MTISFPDVDFDVWNWRAGRGFYAAEHEEGFAGGVGADAGAGGERGGVVGVEGAEDGALG